MQKKKRISAAVVLAAKRFARKYYNNHPYYIHLKGTFDGWIYFNIRRKGLPRYSGLGSLIRVYKNGKVDKDTYLLPIKMASRPLRDTPNNREWIAAIIRDGKKANRKRDEFLRTHPEFQKGK